jgi:hypothetical protein
VTHCLIAGAGVRMYGLEDITMCPTEVPVVGSRYTIWPCLAEDDTPFSYKISWQAREEPGYQVMSATALDSQGESVPTTVGGLSVPQGAVYATRDIPTQTVRTETAKQPTITVEVEVEGDVVPPAEAGYYTFHPDYQASPPLAGGQKHYDRYNDEQDFGYGASDTELVAITAAPHCAGFHLVRWRGKGTVYDSGGYVRMDVSLEATDAEPELWVTDQTIYIKCENVNDGETVASSRALTAFFACDPQVRFITPRSASANPPGDPVESPIGGGDGQNEVVFTSYEQGELWLHLKARATICGMTEDDIRRRFVFEVDAIEGSTLRWDDENPDGGASYDGTYLTATAWFENLPEENSSFGLKEARIKFDGKEEDSAPYEVFFPKTAANHPKGGDHPLWIDSDTWPNWMFYWMQTIELPGTPAPKVVLASGSCFPNDTPDRIWVGSDIGNGNGYGPAYRSIPNYNPDENSVWGIDRLAWAATHEALHRIQWLSTWETYAPGTGTEYWKNHKGEDYVGDSEDYDGERLANGWERSSGVYDWEKPCTRVCTVPHPRALNDEEDRCCYAGRNICGDQAADWAYPGYQSRSREDSND